MGEVGEVDIAPRNEILQSNPEVYWQEGLRRKGNLEASLKSYREANPEHWQEMRDAPVWIRPNMADPNFPNSCTNPEALETVVGELINGGAKDIMIGDIPSRDYLASLDQKGETISSAFIKLKYAEVSAKIKALHPEVNIRVFDPQTLDKEDIEGLATVVRPPEGVKTIINLVRPKEHGQYQFTCGTKNIVGLMTPESRGVIHNHGSNEEVTQIFQEKIRSERAKGIEPDRSAKQQLVLDSYTEAANQNDETNATIMAAIVGKTTQYLSEQGVRVLTVADGEMFMTGHEHSGQLQSLNLAAVSENPLALDLLIADRLGLKGEVPYLRHLRGMYASTPNLVGIKVKEIAPRKISRKMIDVVFKEDGNFTYKFGLDSEIPPGGFMAEVRRTEAIKKPEPSLENVKTLGNLETYISRMESLIAKLTAPSVKYNSNERAFLRDWATDLNKTLTENKARERLGVLQKQYDWSKVADMRKINLEWLIYPPKPLGGKYTNSEFNRELAEHRRCLALYRGQMEKVRQVQSAIQAGASEVFNTQKYIQDVLAKNKLFDLLNKVLYKV